MRLAAAEQSDGEGEECEPPAGHTVHFLYKNIGREIKRTEQLKLFKSKTTALITL